jgi:effector-binding domain-containing protein
MPKSGPPVEVTHEPTLLVAARRQTIDRTALSEFFDAAYAELVETLAAADVRIVGAPIAWYFRVPDDTVDVAAAFPVADAAPRPLGQDVAEPDVPPTEILTLPGGRCLVTEHVGPYRAWARPGTASWSAGTPTTAPSGVGTSGRCTSARRAASPTRGAGAHGSSSRSAETAEPCGEFGTACRRRRE